MIYEYWVIKHIPTNFLLPEIAGGKAKRGGYTHQDPADPTKIKPRLFKSKRNAKIALRAYLEGVWITSFEDVSPEEGYWVLDTIKPKQDRVKEEFEIQRVELHV